MIIKLAAASTLLVFLLAGCASNSGSSATTAKKIYNSQEYKMMTYCIGITDSATNIATEKLKGTPKKKIQEYYATRPQSVLNLATVDKVFNDNVTSVWDYSVAFFGECSNNMAKVPPDRINMASYCMQNQLMADVTHSYKTAGAPIDKAYAHFAKFNTKTSHVIIDKVYESTLSRAEIKMDVWNSCMDVLVNKQL